MTEKMVKEDMLEEIWSYLNSKEIVIEDEADLQEALEDFQSEAFVDYLNETQAEKLWSAHLNEDEEIEIEIFSM